MLCHAAGCAPAWQNVQISCHLSESTWRRWTCYHQPFQILPGPSPTLCSHTSAGTDLLPISSASKYFIFSAKIPRNLCTVIHLCVLRRLVTLFLCQIVESFCATKTFPQEHHGCEERKNRVTTHLGWDHAAAVPIAMAFSLSSYLCAKHW
jgi:hypothetical protein